MTESSHVVRQWGHYVDHYRTPDTVLKTLVVLPGRSTSLQRHMHRSEFWVVRSGTGIAVLENALSGMSNVKLLRGDEIIVEVGKKHQIHNTGDVPLVITELQHGRDCRETDIVRYVE